MGRGMIPVPSVPIRIGFLLLVLVVIIHDLVVGVIILTVLRAAGYTPCPQTNGFWEKAHPAPAENETP